MMPLKKEDTAMSEAFARAGVVPASDRLSILAREAWIGRESDTDKAKRRRHITAALRLEMTWALVELTQGGNAVLAKAVGEALQRAWDEIEAAKPKRKRHLTVVRPEPTPDPQAAPASSKRMERRAAALEKTALRLSKLDTVLANGRPIGDLTPTEAIGWAESRERDARFVRMICSGLPPDRPIRDSVKGDEADGMWEVAIRGPETKKRKP
jgi:hypothetical protein